MPNLNLMHAIFTFLPLALALVVAVLAIWALILAIKALRKYLRTPDAPQQSHLLPPAEHEIN